ncbi:MAG: class I SAM-dependent methyltransferase [Betaproteobacteria bacterium]|nr:MAG: class I SAM-dependent methyltransferase [Betaproteobacteria bacterium]TAG48990.1 MAG: class I SAM-dependent methyltransferase [Betaproteobacteria bacterium]
MADKTTHFGYQTVNESEKQSKVRGVFDSVASKYDVMNDAMSGGLHRVWKRFAVDQLQLRKGEKVLDLASGTGDLIRLMKPLVGESGTVVHTDINAAMLTEGRNALIDRGVLAPSAQCNAEALPFPDRSFDAVTIAFGLRNVTRKELALAEMYRVLKVGGRALVLEFSKPNALLKGPYDWYSFNVLPKLGAKIAGDASSYQYLAESIRMHPSQDELKAMFESVGFARAEYFNLTGGIVAVHRGYRLHS